jgi:hypothetical protein
MKKPTLNLVTTLGVVALATLFDIILPPASSGQTLGSSQCTAASPERSMEAEHPGNS